MFKKLLITFFHFFKNSALRFVHLLEGEMFNTSSALGVSENLPIIRGGIDFHAEPGSKMLLGKRVMFNSDALRYPNFMHYRVKIRILRQNGVVKIGEFTRMHGSYIECYDRIEIGSRCLIAANCQIMDAGGHRISEADVTQRIKNIGFDTAPVIIEDDVWLGLGVIVLPGVRIGRGTVIAAGAIVSRDIPAMVVAGGIPAKVIKKF